MLHVWNPRGGWWGEGDEKFFVDGEKFPSTFGTGSEDYFGYAWCHPGLFQRPFHCQTMTMSNQGHQSVLRWHVADNIPFQTVVRGLHREVLPHRREGHALRLHGLLVPGPRRRRSLRAGAGRRAPRLLRQAAPCRPVASACSARRRAMSRPRGWPITTGQVDERRPALVDRRQAGRQARGGRAGQEGRHLRGERRADQGPRLRHRAALLDGKKAGEPIDLYNPPTFPPSRSPWARSSWPRVNIAGRRDRGSQRQGRQDLHVRARSGDLEAKQVAILDRSSNPIDL